MTTMYKIDTLTGVQCYVPDPPQTIEIAEEDAREWGEAHHFYGAVVESCLQKILKEVQPNETLAQVSARLGYGNTDDVETQKWYYDHKVLIQKDAEKGEYYYYCSLRETDGN